MQCSYSQHFSAQYALAREIVLSPITSTIISIASLTLRPAPASLAAPKNSRDWQQDARASPSYGTSPFCVLTNRQRADRVRTRYSPERRDNKNRLSRPRDNRDGCRKKAGEPLEPGQIRLESVSKCRQRTEPIRWGQSASPYTLNKCDQ